MAGRSRPGKKLAHGKGAGRRGRPRRTFPALLLVAAAIAVALAAVVVPRLLVGGDNSQDVGEVAATSAPQRAGDLAVSASSVDLGHIPLDSWANYSFRLRNEGQAPLVVTVREASVSALQGC